MQTFGRRAWIQAALAVVCGLYAPVAGADPGAGDRGTSSTPNTGPSPAVVPHAGSLALWRDYFWSAQPFKVGDAVVEVGRWEIPWRMWCAVLSTNEPLPACASRAESDLPVTDVTRVEVEAFVAAARQSSADLANVALPTEDEWLEAAKHVVATQVKDGCLLVGNFKGAADINIKDRGRVVDQMSDDRLADVRHVEREKCADRDSLRFMFGNAAEWVATSYRRDAGLGETNAHAAVLGGSYREDAPTADMDMMAWLAGVRSGLRPNEKSASVGFRLVRRMPMPAGPASSSSRGKGPTASSPTETAGTGVSGSASSVGASVPGPPPGTAPRESKPVSPNASAPQGTAPPGATKPLPTSGLSPECSERLVAFRDQYEVDQRAFACLQVLEDPYFKARFDGVTKPPLAQLPWDAVERVNQLLSELKVNLPKRRVRFWTEGCGELEIETYARQVTCDESEVWRALLARQTWLRGQQP